MTKLQDELAREPSAIYFETIRSDLAALEVEVDGWKAEAKRENANAAHHREKREQAEAALAEAQEKIARLHYLRPEVQAFARLMEDRLRLHDTDRGSAGWQGESQTWLFERLLDEVRELKYASGDKIGSEAADVGNFAMMIADTSGALAGGPR